MCGAFSVILTPSGWKEVFRVATPAGWHPVYNARPGEMLPIITSTEPEKTTVAKWDYRPHWLKNSRGHGVINARAESIATKPYFRHSFTKQRCLIPADGFYEWSRQGKISIPYRFTRRDKKPFSFAGIYDVLPETEDKKNIGFAIITTLANDLVGKIHDRMPVILPTGQEELWLNAKTPPATAQDLLQPYPDELMTMYSVSRRVNYAREKGPEVIKPIPK
jgi:putative SOS response-associated peptidase YedK